MNDTHEAIKSRHLAARIIQTAYAEYTVACATRAENTNIDDKEDTVKLEDVAKPTLDINEQREVKMEDASLTPSSNFGDMESSVHSVFTDLGGSAKQAEQDPFCVKNEASVVPVSVNTEAKSNEMLTQLSPPSCMSGMEEKNLAKFVSAVVVVQTYLHETREKKNVNAGLTQMDEFEYEYFYKGMLYGVTDPETAMKQIVVCQSAARRMLAHRRVQDMKKCWY